MTYPPAPWHLYGSALQSFYLIDLETARILVPIDLEIVSILPGKTLGGLYLSVYDAQSTLSYHELIVVSALVRYQGKIGSWISHIYVDHPDSVQGGRNIWGLPKEMADFNWDDHHIKVSQGHTGLCQAKYSQTGVPLSLWNKYNICGNVFSRLDQDILKFQGNFETRLKWIQCRLSIPSESPFSLLKLDNPLLTLQMRDLHLTAHSPSIAGHWSSELLPKAINL